jgi:hypothetical protein
VYLLTLLVHSMIVRWLVLLAVGIRVGTAAWGLSSGGSWGATDKRLSLVPLILVDTQVLIGLVLYFFLSPNVHQAMGDVGAAMKDGHLRYYLVEHPTLMILAAAALHVGNVLVKRAGDDRRRYVVTTVASGAALVLLLLGVYLPH